MADNFINEYVRNFDDLIYVIGLLKNKHEEQEKELQEERIYESDILELRETIEELKNNNNDLKNDIIDLREEKRDLEEEIKELKNRVLAAEGL